MGVHTSWYEESTIIYSLFLKSISGGAHFSSGFLASKVVGGSFKDFLFLIFLTPPFAKMIQFDLRMFFQLGEY